MNTPYSNTQAKSNLFPYVLIALAALIALYWFVNIGNMAAAQLLPTLSTQTTQAQSDGPVPVPVPTPPVTQIQATPTPPAVVQSNPAPVPQPVPTPPAIP